MSIQLYLSEAWTVDISDWITVHVDSAKEIGAFWFVIFDGNGVDIDKCGLVAEEREPGRYYGFWTYDPDIVDELVSYLEAQYDAS